METYPDCFSCIVRQTVAVVDNSGLSREVQLQALKEVLNRLSIIDPGLSPSAIAGETNQILRSVLGIDDFYLQEKAANHQLAFSYLDELRQLIRTGSDLLEQGLKISAAGNVIDVIHIDEYDLWQEVVATVSQDLVGGGLEPFRERISEASHLLYLADNVGETVFDRVLIETLSIPVYYAVKSGPILNDATRQDALAAGIDQVAEVIETGSRSPGTILEQCSPEFQDLFRRSSLVISKGQANYETMDEAGEKVFFLLRVKCPVLSQRFDAPLGSLVFQQGIRR